MQNLRRSRSPVLAWGRTGPASFYATSDGARHWRPAAPNVPLGHALQLDFVTSRVGFVLVGRPTTDRTTLFRAHDGGHTWVALPSGAGTRV